MMDTVFDRDRQTAAEGRATANSGSRQAVEMVYFASVREGLGTDREHLDLPSHVATVEGLIDFLRTRGEAYGEALREDKAIRVAVDRVHADPQTSIAGAREIAIFPMMTGG